MEVRITKASKDTYWYANCIGERYEVTGVREEIYEVRKWIQFPKTYDIAPVLKIDCEEIYIKRKFPDPERHSNGKSKPDKTINLFERSGLNTSREIKEYEELNKKAKLTIYHERHV